MGYTRARLVRHGGRWRALFWVGKRRYFRTLGTNDEHEARSRWQEILDGGMLPQLFTAPKALDVPTGRQIHRAWRRARHAAPSRKLEFNLTLDEARELYAKQGGCCAISGIPFDATFKVGKNPRRPFHASIDRIDSDVGYSKENCRWVCVAVNQALGEWGEETLFKIVAAIAIKQGRKQWHTKREVGLQVL